MEHSNAAVIRRLKISDLKGKSALTESFGQCLYLRSRIARGILVHSWIVRVQGKGSETIGIFNEKPAFIDDHLSISQAKEKAVGVARKIRIGSAPQNDVVVSRTLVQVLREYHVDQCKTSKPSTTRVIDQRIRNFIEGQGKQLGGSEENPQPLDYASTQIADITDAGVEIFIDELIELGASPDQAAKIHHDIGGALTYAAASKRAYIAINPLHGKKNPFKKAQTKRRDKKANDALNVAQIEKLLQNIHNIPATQSHIAHYRYGILISLAYGLRSVEIARLRWDFLVEDNAGNRVLDIPGSLYLNNEDCLITKNERDLKLPITDWAWKNIFAPLKELTSDSEWIIPHGDSRNAGYSRCDSVAKAIQSTIARAPKLHTKGRKKLWAVHCLRTTVKSLLTELRATDDVNHAIVNHIEGDAHERYNTDIFVNGEKKTVLTRYHAVLETIKLGKGQEYFKAWGGVENDPGVILAEKLQKEARRGSLKIVA